MQELRVIAADYTAPRVADGSDEGASARRQRLAYVLFMMFLLNCFNFTDRFLFGVVQELVKVDLSFTDFQLGLLGGPAFAVLYTLTGIPIARLAERRSRINIISLSFAVWSAMTMACGFAGNYVQMLMARAGVSIGEAGCTPPAHSLMADSFRPGRRASALAVFSTGAPVGALLAAMVGGTIAQHFGWRWAFWVCGGTGILVALVLRLTVREPVRSGTTADVPPLGVAVRTLLRKPSFVHVSLAGAISTVGGAPIVQYLASFLMRSHGLAVGQASLVLALVMGVVGAIGTLSSGALIDLGRARFPRIATWLPTTGLLIAGVGWVAALLSPSLAIAIPLMLVASLGQNSYMGAMLAVAQGVAPARMRATSAALLILILNIIGYGLGPPLTGAFSDWLMHSALADAGLAATACSGANSPPLCQMAQAQGLRWALAASALLFFWAAAHYFWSGRTVELDKAD